ncbi:hypothetical protein Patl1_23580 [Pistacia atlantica]|uniref:Uncharacterized protein n=1 Tax=Pistacia atlantica TaxID=434234 RepID=A0ACC0ZZ79_9ROSI|nr:hypothetical protein Patl1_23580 [Pistacia atlantica]
MKFQACGFSAYVCEDIAVCEVLRKQDVNLACDNAVSVACDNAVSAYVCGDVAVCEVLRKQDIAVCEVLRK